MLTRMTRLPYSILTIMSNSTVVATEKHKNRTDLLVDDNLGTDLAVEMLFNEINNTSGIDFSPGSYRFPSNNILREFLGVK